MADRPSTRPRKAVAKPKTAARASAKPASAGEPATPVPPTPAPAPRPTRPQRRRISDAAHAASSERGLYAVPDPCDDEPMPQPAAMPGTSEIEAAIGGLVTILRTAGAAVGMSGDDLEQRIAQALAFVRRRLTGDYDIDDFGFDSDFTDQVWLPLLRPLYRRWFRVEVRGIENIPADGSALVVANHSGTLPIDGLMTQVAIHDEHPQHRHVRMLGADLVFSSPVVGQLSRRAGTTLAANADAERLLKSGELVAVWPEGFKGVGKPFSERYRLQRFGRGGFVSAAMRSGAPIIPCSIVGAEEIYPLIGNLKGLARLLGTPYFPVTPTFPFLGLAGLIPLPSKWIIEFGAPIETAGFGTAGAEDPMLVFELTDQVRETIQQSLYSLLMQRRSVFF
ncbi:lysophospholipid acyltransferase family protein [Rudaeicoccus suwonensis]|uniref:1-acyl-sn-glycerol-3-phosphate acyltransferase n=1 Tax=Rudaeicoccus suwonensis TaxID=657409 RepID=A0A561DU62_9MICO|nr:lysophospholipid acyltransferase family protein [Rudaeicoccus suwonensis]TWE06906.1 1-acyl-sn-glycerol-3-phosphate acyltransferase [Rudaeicoccus suwonensis]